MVSAARRNEPAVRHEVADFSISLVGDSSGLICAQLETHDNRWPIRASEHPDFVNGVRDLLSKGRRKITPWSVDANLDCEVAYTVVETPWDCDTDRGTQHRTDRSVVIDKLTVIHRDRTFNNESHIHSTLVYGRVEASKKLIDEFAPTLIDEIESRL